MGTESPGHGKLAEGDQVVAGLPAGYALYEAGSTKTKVVIARGSKTDFVFMFFAPISYFEKLSVEFEWILAGFRPAPAERPAEPARMAQHDQPEEKQPPLRAENAAGSEPCRSAAACRDRKRT